MTTEIRPEQLLTILKHLTSGKGIEVVASIIHLPADTVREIAVAHGYPDREKLGYAVDEAQRQLDAARSRIPDSTLPQTPSRPRPVPAPASTPPAPAVQVPAAQKPDDLRALIDTAKGHDRVRIQKLADKILEDLAKLRGLVDEEKEAFQTRQREAREKAAAKAEVERLERELKAARDKLRPTKKATPTAATTQGKAGDDEPSAADVRSWAIQKGIEVPSRGRLPQEIREAYDDAHQQAS